MKSAVKERRVEVTLDGGEGQGGRRMVGEEGRKILGRKGREDDGKREEFWGGEGEGEKPRRDK